MFGFEMIQMLLLFGVVSVALCDFKLLLLHTNDMHSVFQEVDRYFVKCKDQTSLSCYGGFARLRQAVRQSKLEAERSGRHGLFLNAGDTFEGPSPLFNKYQWRVAATMMNALELDAMSLGNHEFNIGLEGLTPYLQQMRAPVVCCNLDLSEEPELEQTLAPSTVISFNHTKVGIVGYLTPDTANRSSAHVGHVKFDQEIPRIREEAQRLIKDGVKIIIALGHSGYLMDMKIAEEVEEVDVVVGGHSHTFLYSGPPPSDESSQGPYPTVVTRTSGQQVPVVQAFWGTKYLGRMELDFDDDGNLKSFTGAPVLLRGNITQDQTVLRALQPYVDKFMIEGRKIIGQTHVFLNQSKCLTSECNIGNMIVDAFVDHMTKHCPRGGSGWTIAAVGMLHVGGIRVSLDVVSGGLNGSLTVEDMMTVLPYGNRLLVVNVTGQTLLNFLTCGLNKYVFMQVSGLRVTYAQNEKKVKRVVHAEVLCVDCEIPKFEALQPHRWYGVVLPDYLVYKAKSCLPALANHSLQCVSKSIDYEVLSQYVQTYTPLNPQVEGRIVIYQSDANVIITVGVVCGLASVFLLILFLSDIEKLNLGLKCFSFTCSDLPKSSIVSNREESEKLVH